jgi:hypothetical protein
VEHWHAENYARWLRVGAHQHVVRAECLHQSLAGHQWLRAQGASSDFVMDGLVGDVDAGIAPFAELTAHGAEPWQ